MRLEYGSERVQVVAGDSAYIDAVVEHRLSNRLMFRRFDVQAV
jgi:mannose-6-phosphate isomerase-like protein (cupin superfamily)